MPKTIVLPSGDTVKTINLIQWQYVLFGFGQLFDCSKELEAANKVIEAQEKELAAKDSALAFKNDALAIVDTIADVKKILTRREKRQEWWKKFKKDIGITVISAVAVAEGAYILYVGLKP